MEVSRHTSSRLRTLNADDVHVWRFGLDRPGDVIRRMEIWLAPEEHQRADRFLGPRLRDRYVVGRGVLRQLLDSYLGCGPARLRFRYGPRGKPALDWPKAAPPLLFNLSHSGGRAVLAVALGRQLGVDIEQMRPLPEDEAIVRRFFSPSEVREFLAQPPELRLTAFYSGWTRKEAFLKATGGGLADALHSFDVTLSPAIPPRLIRAPRAWCPTESWSLYQLDPSPGFVGALAVEGTGHNLHYFELP